MRFSVPYGHVSAYTPLLRRSISYVNLEQQRKHHQGTLAEYVRVSSGSVTKRPKNITPTQAAGISLVALTAAIALFEKGQLEPNQHVFINGGSTAVGLAVIQLAKASGCKVTATGSGPKEELLKSLGADEARHNSGILMLKLR